MYLVNGNKIWYPGIFPGHDTTINGKTLHFVFSFHAQGFKSGSGH